MCRIVLSRMSAALGQTFLDRGQIVDNLLGR
jgi:hypothetical protein